MHPANESRIDPFKRPDYRMRESSVTAQHFLILEVEQVGGFGAQGVLTSI